jgi:hypothetical protein
MIAVVSSNMYLACVSDIRIISRQDQFVAYSAYQSIGQSFYYDATYMLGSEQYLRPGWGCFSCVYLIISLRRLVQ